MDVCMYIRFISFHFNLFTSKASNDALYEGGSNNNHIEKNNEQTKMCFLMRSNKLAPSMRMVWNSRFVLSIISWWQCKLNEAYLGNCYGHWSWLSMYRFPRDFGWVDISCHTLIYGEGLLLCASPCRVVSGVWQVPLQLTKAVLTYQAAWQSVILGLS